MASNNPSITASAIITDVEARLGTPNISTTVYLPWISYAYQKTHQALAGAGQRVKEELFGNFIQISLTGGTAEYALSDHIPRFGGFIKVEIKYGATGDDWVKAKRLNSLSAWTNQNNVSTQYRPKGDALYYLLDNKLGFIPTPPSTDPGSPVARIWYIERGFQITSGDDTIDIPYRFIYPIVNYVQSRAIEKENEDYAQARLVEEKFNRELEEIAIAAASEYDEFEGVGIVVSPDSQIYNDPFRY